MAEVTVRDAHRKDAPVIADVWSAAVPYVVRSSARVAADMHQDATLERRRWVAVLDGEVCGTATSRRTGVDEVFLNVEVHPDHGSRGVGTALLRLATTAFPGVWHLQSVATGDPIAMSFAVRNGFLPDGRHEVASVDTGTVPPAGAPPHGLRAVTLSALPDLRMLLDTHNRAADDDPSGLTRRYTMYQLRVDWWDSPDNASDLSWGLLADAPGGPVLASFTSVQVDRERGRAWSSMTATHPAYRGRGLATWVKQRMLNSLAEARVPLAWTANDPANPPMLAVNAALGYAPVAASIPLTRRLPKRTG